MFALSKAKGLLHRNGHDLALCHADDLNWRGFNGGRQKMLRTRLIKIRNGLKCLRSLDETGSGDAVHKEVNIDTLKHFWIARGIATGDMSKLNEMATGDRIAIPSKRHRLWRRRCSDLWIRSSVAPKLCAAFP